MIAIDQAAYCSPLQDIHPGEKMLLAVSTMLLVIAMNSALISMLVFVLMSYLILIPARTPLYLYLKLLAIPLGFVILGTITVAINIGNPSGEFATYLVQGKLTLWVNQASLFKAGNLLLKSLASINCLYFFSLTTPMPQMIHLMYRLRLPTVLVELTALVYYYIFVFLEIATSIYIAQRSRGGYKGWRSTMQSMAILSSNLFMKSLKACDDSYNGLLTRGFNGQFLFLQEKYKTSLINLLGIICLNLFLIGMFIYWRYYNVF